jgi:hypothetical protein
VIGSLELCLFSGDHRLKFAAQWLSSCAANAFREVSVTFEEISAV